MLYSLPYIWLEEILEAVEDDKPAEPPLPDPPNPPLWSPSSGSSSGSPPLCLTALPPASPAPLCESTIFPSWFLWTSSLLLSPPELPASASTDTAPVWIRVHLYPMSDKSFSRWPPHHYTSTALKIVKSAGSWSCWGCQLTVLKEAGLKLSEPMNSRRGGWINLLYLWHLKWFFLRHSTATHFSALNFKMMQTRCITQFKLPWRPTTETEHKRLTHRHQTHM